MKAVEIRALTDEQLAVTLKDTIKSLFQLRVKAETDKVESKNEITKARREIARLKTIIRLRELKRPEGHTVEKRGS